MHAMIIALILSTTTPERVQTAKEVTISAHPTWVCGAPRKLENDAHQTVKECKVLP